MSTFQTGETLSRIRSLLAGRGTVDRTGYFIWGAGLAALKFNLDLLLTVLGGRPAGELPGEFLGFYLWQHIPREWMHTSWLLPASLETLPFAYLGIVLTLARLRSAGMKPWWVFLFFVPAVKLVFFGLLCVVAEKPRDAEDTAGQRTLLEKWGPKTPLGAAIAAVVFTGTLAAGLVGTSTFILGDYGWSLFLAIPFIAGFISSLIYNARGAQTLRNSMGVSLLTMGVTGLVLVAFAWEGIICIAMAAPLGIGLSVLGSVMAHGVLAAARRKGEAQPTLCAALLLLPLTMATEHASELPAPLLRVTSALEIDAPPAVVWRHVVSFAELPAPSEWLFRTGVAYPIRATIQGRGVGAIRYCEFSTGSFVEPIQVWEEPRLLRFGVTHNPEPMEEWTPYRQVHPPHLKGYLESQQGQFLLEKLPGGRTRLEGTTWYRHHLWPVGYWQGLSDYIIHTIHLRVLNHVKNLAEHEANQREPVN